MKPRSVSRPPPRNPLRHVGRNIAVAKPENRAKAHPVGVWV